MHLPKLQVFLSTAEMDADIAHLCSARLFRPIEEGWFRFIAVKSALLNAQMPE